MCAVLNFLEKKQDDHDNYNERLFLKGFYSCKNFTWMYKGKYFRNVQNSFFLQSAK